MSPERAPFAARRRAGLTLIELVVAIVVVSIALSSMLLVLDRTARASADPLLERQAIALADAYLAEILPRAFQDPDDGALCPTPEASRSLYDNVCDYHGLDDLGPRDQDGNPLAALDGYRVQISVDASASLGAIPAGQTLRIDALVTDPMGRPVRLSAYRTGP